MPRKVIAPDKIPIHEIYGGNLQTITWAKKHCLKYVPGGDYVAWLVSGGPYKPYRHGYSFLDHLTGWKDEKGSRLLLAQPYNCTYATLIDITKFCQENELEVTVITDGWYGHGTIGLLFGRDADNYWLKQWQG